MMNCISKFLLNKINLIDALVIISIVLFLSRAFQVWPQIDSLTHDPFASVMVNVGGIVLTLFGALYQPAILLALAKVMQLLEEKKNATN